MIVRPAPEHLARLMESRKLTEAAALRAVATTDMPAGAVGFELADEAELPADLELSSAWRRRPGGTLTELADGVAEYRRGAGDPAFGIDYDLPSAQAAYAARLQAALDRKVAPLRRSYTDAVEEGDDTLAAQIMARIRSIRQAARTA